MEYLLECYLDSFKHEPRNSLHDRRNRRNMVDYINVLIQGCAGVDSTDTQKPCEEAITTLIQYHNKFKSENGRVCMMDLVCQLLKEIYACEQTFERILIGALFGTKAPHYIAGWKSDFENQEENIRGLVYFLDKANLGKLQLPFVSGDTTKQFRFVDLPIESCGKASPLKVCLQLGLPDKLLILLRFGAIAMEDENDFSNFEHIMNRLMEFNHCYPYNLVSCLQLLLKVVPSLQLKLSEAEPNKLTRDILVEKYGDLIEDGLIPLNRCGYIPPELKHLSRCAIRFELWKNFNIPNGIRQLPLPETMWRYLDLLEN
ncbi:uncharacterized protein LOC126744500 isoform X2 [Anthonomus grandis grandis]|uniref:uncharacterized protein LOC126744500 isoform X2 n=1 Tax=Anthonomus grandis grandis TaxID=2921223 RepID=UPI002166BEF8|nr:uncharacterized protein LOC126744500 isoform X2 [Anthonomus grandis grandis]